MYNLWKIGALNLGDLLVIYYKTMGLDETTCMFLILFAKLLKESPDEWSIKDISNLMTLETSICSQLFMRLINDGYISISAVDDKQGRRKEVYSLKPLFTMLEKITKKESAVENKDNLTQLSVKLEQVFGVLSPKDIEMIHYWINEDGFQTDIIELAVKEMQQQEIRTLKYVDKILLDWKRNNIFTIDAAKKRLIDFRRLKVETARTGYEKREVPAEYEQWVQNLKQGLK